MPKEVYETLTKREQEIVRLIDAGRTTREVADDLYISKRTVDFHLARIFEKLQVTNRVQMLNRARALGYLEPEKTAPSGALCPA